MDYHLAAMLLTLTTTHSPATDLGYLLHKNPARPQTFNLSVGQARVFYPEANASRCTAALMLDIDPVGLVRNRRGPSEKTSAPTLNYAPPRRFARMRRWLRPGSPVFILLVVALAGAGAWGAWGVWKWRLKADEKAFNERTYVGPYNAGWITFSKPPNPASLRHLNRLPGTWSLYFDWRGPEDPAAPLVLRGRRCTRVTTLWLGSDVNADAWLKELARPDSGFKSLTYLDLNSSQVTDADLKELARPDSGLAALPRLELYGTQVTDAGLKELARKDTGLKALTTLGLWSTQVTDAGLKELARPDCGLKALTSLVVHQSRVTDAGIAELKKARPGLSIE